VKINFDTQGINTQAGIEPLLLLPFIENVFKHGLQDETGEGFAEIVICLTGNELLLQCRNSKPSGKQAGEEWNGIGQDNVRKRLDLLYPGKYKLLINETATEYEIVLNLQLKKHD
jgi:LytS/YehU family sensor histidine kinase